MSQPCCTKPCPKRLNWHANNVKQCSATLIAGTAPPPLKRFAGAVVGFAAALHDCDCDKQKQLDEMSSAMQTLGGQLAVQLDAIEQDNARKRGEIVTLVEILRAETRAPR
jgi:hypothetical protein